MGTNTRGRRHQYSITLGQLTQSYLYWAETSLRPSTLETYRVTISAFRDFLGPEVKVDDIGDMAVQRYIRSRIDAGKAANTVRTDHRRLCAFFAWAVEREHVTRNWAMLAKPPREEKPLLRSTTEEEFERLLTYTHGQEMAYRNRALLWLLHDTGMRLGECSKLKLTDIDLDQRFVRIRPEDTKDAEGRIAPFTVPCRTALHDYLVFERGQPVTVMGNQVDNLWTSSRQPTILTQGLKRELLKLGQRAGVPFGAHDLRRAFVARCLASGMPESLIMEMTGHRSPEMVARYGKPRAQENAIAAYREKLG